MMPPFADDHDGFVLPNVRFNPTAAPPSCSGLLTPPESPKSSHAPLLTRMFTQTPTSSYENYELPAASCFGAAQPEPHSAHQDLSRVSETIYTIIEQVIEQKLAEAMGPLRLNVRRLDSESLEFHEQNDTLGCQVRRLEGQVNVQLQTLQNISAATSNNLEIISALSNQLSNTTNSIQRATELNHQQFSLEPVPPSQHYLQQHHSVQPQFCFKPRGKRQSKLHKKSRKSGFLKFMLLKWKNREEEIN